MADQKITDLTADTAPTSDDLVVTVNDPAGTPVNRKVTVTNLAKGMIGGSNQYVQFNNSGVFGGSGNLQWLSPWLMLSVNNSGIVGWTNDGANLIAGIIGNKAGIRAITTGSGAPSVFYSETVESSSAATLQPWHVSGQVFRRVMTGSPVTIARPQSDGGTGSASGPILTIILVQDGTGSRLASWATEYKWVGGVAPTLTTTANATDIFRFWVDASNQAWEISRALDVK